MSYTMNCECGSVEISTCHCLLTTGLTCVTCEAAIRNFKRKHRQCDLFIESQPISEKVQEPSGRTPGEPTPPT